MEADHNMSAREMAANPILTKPFNYEQEVKRKANLEKLFMRTKEQQDKEKQMVEDAKKLE